MKCMFTFFVLSIPRSGDIFNILWHTGFVYPGSLYDTMFHTQNASLANCQKASVKRLRPENNGLYSHATVVSYVGLPCIHIY